VLKAAITVLLAAGIACAAAPASSRTHLIAPGVKVLGTRVGGLTALPAERRIERAVSRPITVVYRGEAMVVTPEQLGAHTSVDRAVRAALAATPHSRIGLPVEFSDDAVRDYVAGLAQRFARKPVSAKLLGADTRGPVFRDSRLGLEVEQEAATAAIEQQLRAGSRAPIALSIGAVEPARTPASFRSIVVIDRAANSLRLYRGRSLVRAFAVATGQSYYPTPSGMFSIVNMQENPWWYPPNSSWAQGLKPVPPGPGNPLGTRWMGISAPGVGMHGTPDDASIGYSESHGCIRMHIPDAEWLFEHVHLGTPVVIL
jgi:lipoprotein-anchoring transpeptidase ErfK/SrfK